GNRKAGGCRDVRGEGPVRSIGFIAVAVMAATAVAQAQEDKRTRIDVESYTIDAQVNPDTQTLSARAAVRFTPLEDQANTATFELNNNLTISRIVDGRGQAIQVSRNQQDNSVRLTFPGSLQKGQPVD